MICLLVDVVWLLAEVVDGCLDMLLLVVCDDEVGCLL